MNFTRNRLVKVPIQRNTVDNLNIRRSCAISLSSISDEEIIYVDETGFNLDTNSIYGYSPVNQKSFRMVPAGKGLNVSLLCAISLRGLITYQIFDGSINSEKFQEFTLNKLSSKKIERETILILDNASIHKSHNTISCIHSVGMTPRFLPPYSPQLNPIEEYFSCIKAAYKGFRPIPQNREELKAALNTILMQNSFETSGYFRDSRRYIEQALARNLFI